MTIKVRLDRLTTVRIVRLLHTQKRKYTRNFAKCLPDYTVSHPR